MSFGTRSSETRAIRSGATSTTKHLRPSPSGCLTCSEPPPRSATRDTAYRRTAKGIAIGGGDENSAKDQGRCLAHLQMLRDETGCHTAIIHHTGKDVKKGARGSNAQIGDVDVEFTISGDGEVRIVRVTKANDQPEGEVLRFTITSKMLSVDDDGDAITVGILADEEMAADQRQRREWPEGLHRLRDTINEALGGGSAFDYQILRGATVRAVHLDVLRAMYRQKVVAVNPNPKRPYSKADGALQRDMRKAEQWKLIGTANAAHRGVVWLV